MQAWFLLGFLRRQTPRFAPTPVHLSSPPSPHQQTLGHPPRNVRARGCAPGALALLAIAAFAGCGEVHFVPAPFTPTAVELIYSEQENITVMRWRVAATQLSQTRFEMLGPNGYQTIDFSKSVFTGGVNACTEGEGSCAQYVVRGLYTVDKDQRPVQAVHDTFGVLPGGIPTTKTVPVTLKDFASIFGPKNDAVYVTVSDAVAAAGPYSFPRPYEQTMWPTNGLCVGETTPAGVSFSPLDPNLVFPPPTPLSDDGIYCVAARPLPADDGGAVMLQARIATAPVVVTGRQMFDPPVERSPIIYQLILDLDIPVPDRCTDVVQKIEALTARYLSGGGVPVRKLPTINLAADSSSQCAQTTGRTVAAADIAQAVKETVQTFPGVHQQVHMMYFNNLDAPLPATLSMSLQTLFDALAGSLPGYDLKTFSWLFAPLVAGSAATQYMNWWAFWPWQTADDNFKMMLDQYQQQSLPYTTQFHDPSEPVKLLSDADVTTYDGKLIKICRASPVIQPVGTLPFLRIINQPSWQIAQADPPAYLVTLNNQIVVTASSFVEQKAIVDYQICTRYCKDHPYKDSAGNGEMSWEDSFQCTSGDY